MTMNSIRTNINIHGWNVHIPIELKLDLITLGFDFDGEEINGTVFTKKNFNKAILTLEKIGFEVEFFGSFTTGVFIKTVVYKS